MALTKVTPSMFEGSTGSSGGDENLITDGSGEAASVSIFTPYADAVLTRPVDGTGGTANVTSAINSSNPINGLKDYTLIKDAGNRRGQGWATTVTVPLAYRGKALKLSIKYLVTSGTFVAGNNGATPADGDVIWYLYDITNSKLVEPSNIKMFTSATDFTDVYESTVQFDSNCASVRLIAHVASVSALAYTLQVDDVTLTPNTYVYGTSLKNWETVTVTGSWVTNTTYSARRRQVGDSYLYDVSLALTGAPTAATLSINLPTGDVIDTTKLASGTNTGFNSSINGKTNIIRGSSFTGGVNYTTTTSISPTHFDTNGNGGGITQLLPGTFANGDFVGILFTVPIVGLTATSQMSDAADTRQEYFSATKTAIQSINNISSTKVTFDSYTNNTHGSWDVANNRYVVKTAGPFSLAGTIGWVANGTGYRQVSYSINGGSGEVANMTNSVGAADATVNSFAAITPHLVAGDYIELFVYQNSGAALNAAANLARLRINKIAGPQAIAQSERMYLSVYRNASQALANNTTTAIVFNAKTYDTHNMHNTTTGEATMKRAGVVSVKTAMLTDSHAPSGAWSIGLFIYKNGVSMAESVDTRSETSTSSYPYAIVKDFEVKAGDVIVVSGYRSSVTTFGTFNTANPQFTYMDLILT